MKFLLSISFFLICNIAFVSNSYACDLSGKVTIEERLFLKDPLYDEQKQNYTAIAMQAEYYYEWSSGASFTLFPFIRYNSINHEIYIDIIELNYFFFSNYFEIRTGISKVFWGVTESENLVDIINQTDLIGDLYGEDKLGQPMLNVSFPKDWGVIDIFLLPYFRERTFPSKYSRLRTETPVEVTQARYESSAKERHIDAAWRYSHNIENLDIGIHYFYGTNREPSLIGGVNSKQGSVWIPYYKIIHQIGLDAQYITGTWIWKFESIYRNFRSEENFFASAYGTEYNIDAICNTKINIGFLCEWLYDDRGKNSTSLYDNDLMFGMRVLFNDYKSTEILTGVIEDINSNGTIFTCELSRRLNSSWKIELESFFILNSSNEDMSYQMRKDNHIRAKLMYYF